MPRLHQSRPELGCIRAAEGLLYGCSSPVSLLAFAKDPAGALAAVQRQAKCHPLLVHLLGLQQAVPQCNLHTLLAPAGKTLKVDFSTQTPTHFVEQNIVRDYEWNAWVLRRRALALAEMKRKRTHSTQTAGSHFRRDGQTQVGLGYCPTCAASVATDRPSVLQCCCCGVREQAHAEVVACWRAPESA